MKKSDSSTNLIRWGLFITLAFLLGIAYERGSVEYWLGSPSEKTKAVEKYETAIEKIDNRYIDDVDLSKLTRTALNAIAEKELDRHSAYLNPDRYETFSTGTSGDYVGIGIRVSKHQDTGFIEIAYPFRGSPALKKGIKPGDLIIKIEGTSTKELSMDEAVSRMKGKKGTKVTITLRSRNKDRQVTIERQDVDIPTVARWGILSTEKGPLGYISIRQFSKNTVEAFKKALKRLEKKKIVGLILDLRMNPGGLLTSSVDMADLFLEPDRKIVTVNYRNRDPEVYRSKNKPIWNDRPLAILVNGDSASASEVFAGALRDHDKAALVGTRTFGKGSVQNVFEFRNDSDALKITVARYHTPSGQAIDQPQKVTASKQEGEEEDKKKEKKDGLKPEHVIELAETDEKRKQELEKLLDSWQEGKSTRASKLMSLELYRDAQLKKAIEVINETLSRSGKNK